MADHKILIGDLQNGMVVHHQGQWAENDRVTDPQGRSLALASEVAAAGYGISGAVDTYAELPDPATLPANTLYIVRQDTGAPNGNGLYRIEGDPAAWVFLDALNLQKAAEVPYDNAASGLTGTTVQAAVDEIAAQGAPVAGDGLEDNAGVWSARLDNATLEIGPGDTLVTLAGAVSPAEANAEYKDTGEDFGGKSVWSPDGVDLNLVHFDISAALQQWWMTDRAPALIGDMACVQMDGGDNWQVGTDQINGIHLLHTGTHLQADAVYSKAGTVAGHRIRFDSGSDRWVFEDDMFAGIMFQAATTGLAGLTGVWEDATGGMGVTPPTSVSTTPTMLRADNAFFPDRFYLPDASGLTANLTWKRVGVHYNGTWIYGDAAGSDPTTIYHDGTSWRVMQYAMDMGSASTNVPESTSPVGLTFDEWMQPATMGVAEAEAHFTAATDAGDSPADAATFAAARHGTGTPTATLGTGAGPIRVADEGVGAAQLAAAVAGTGLVGGAGSPLALAPYADGTDYEGGTAWAGGAPTTYGAAIDRIASALALHFGTAIGG
jgi:hypothetical protein